MLEKTDQTDKQKHQQFCYRDGFSLENVIVLDLTSCFILLVQQKRVYTIN